MKKYKKEIGFVVFLILITLYILGGSISYKGLFFYYIGNEEKAIESFLPYAKEGKGSRVNVEKLINLYQRQGKYQELFSLLPNIAFYPKYHKSIVDFLLDHSSIPQGEMEIKILPPVLTQIFNLPPLSLKTYFLDQFDKEILRIATYIDDPSLYKLYRRAIFLSSNGNFSSKNITKFPIDEIDELEIAYQFSKGNLYLESVPEHLENFYNHHLYSWLYEVGTSTRHSSNLSDDVLENFKTYFNSLNERDKNTFLKIFFHNNNIPYLHNYLPDLPQVKLLTAARYLENLSQRKEGLAILEDLSQNERYRLIADSLKNKFYIDFDNFAISFDDFLFCPTKLIDSNYSSYHYWSFDFQKEKHMKVYSPSYEIYNISFPWLKWSPKGDYVIMIDGYNSLTLFKYTSPKVAKSSYTIEYEDLLIPSFKHESIFQELLVLNNVSLYPLYPFDSYGWLSENEFYYTSIEDNGVYIFDIKTGSKKLGDIPFEDNGKLQSGNFHYYFKEIPVEENLSIHILYRKNLMTGKEEELPFFSFKRDF
ncbi:hypothetical protein SAMN02745227_00832 [Anaerobranca californiensis DSM 14826]|uniref:Uncharacterized protein n=1 Tax=Anaerobranca californiensis DSM 14826 TaxID=1120989 RepID=A0A1M6MLE3_9FIRM|nr:hypothetical protein [Anaerobranca californiensis]SHJ84315.1 hypothetical protein SAMN02745227_00832 [Anaerobranca californiensis DSM 14826]